MMLFHRFTATLSFCVGGCVIPAVVLCAVLVCPLNDAPSGADAAEGPEVETIDALLADFKALKKSKDEDATVRLARRAAIVFDNLVDAKQQKVVIDLVGRLPAIKKSERVVHTMLEALGEMGDPRGAKTVKKYLRARNKKKASETLKIAIQTAAKMPDSALVAPLLKLFDKSKLISIKRMAAQSLAHFGSVKRQRAKILEALIRALKKVKPGGPGRMSGGGGGGGGELDSGSGGYGDYGGPAEVWTALSGVMPRILNRLTGQSVSSIDSWFGLFDHNKRNLQALFQD